MINKELNIKGIKPQPYIALLEKNISFAKRHNAMYPNNPMYPKLPETFGLVAIETHYGNFDMYYDETDPFNVEMLSHIKKAIDSYSLKLEIIKCCNAVIDKDNKVIKNRWGDQE